MNYLEFFEKIRSLAPDWGGAYPPDWTQPKRMASNNPITFSLPFLSIRIPELDNLPADEAESVLQRVSGTDEKVKLSQQHMFQFRMAFASLFALAMGFFLLYLCGYSMFIWFALATLAVTFLSLPGQVVIFHLRLRRLLRQLVQRELGDSATQ